MYETEDFFLNVDKFAVPFQTLLRHGANPDLRDEDGKTPMDKARERNDEGHREVVHILQSPGTKFLQFSKLVAAANKITLQTGLILFPCQ